MPRRVSRVLWRPPKRSLAPLLTVCAVAFLWIQLHRPARMVSLDDRLPLDPYALAGGVLGVNPNTASLGELQLLPEVGPSLAERIVAYRIAKGGEPFRRPEDLLAVKGIGAATLGEFRLYLTFDRPATRPSAE